MCTIEGRRYESRLGRSTLAVSVGCWLMLLNATSTAQAPIPSSKNLEVLIAAGDKALGEGDTKTALKTFAAAVATDSSSKQARWRLGGVLLTVGRADEALEQFGHVALELAPEDPEARYRYGIALNQAFNPQQAALQLREALRLQPGHKRARRNLIGLLLSQNAIMQAAEVSNEGVGLAPADASVRNDHGVVLMKLGKVDAAFQSFQEATKLDPSHVDAQYNMGSVLNQQWRLEEARTHLERALEIAPKYVDAHFKLGQVLARTGDDTAAERAFKRVVGLKPESAEGWHQLAMVAVRRNQHQQAVGHLTNALRHNPQLTVSQLQLGKSLLALDRAKLAIPHLRSVIRVETGNAEAYFFLGEAYRAIEEPIQAMICFKEASWLRPEWQAPMDALAELEQASSSPAP